MAAHRYWRLTGFSLPTNGPMELSESRLYANGSLADISGTLTCSAQPTSGVLADLRDGITSQAVSWSFDQIRQPSFALQWDLLTPSEITGLRLGSGGSALSFPKGVALQWSDDSFYWTASWTGTSVAYPGAMMLTAQGSGISVPTWDMAMSNAALMLLSADSLRVTRAGSNSYQAVRGSIAISGKKYWEIGVLSGGGFEPPYGLSGVMTLAAAVSGGVGAVAESWGYHSRDGDLYLNGAQSLLGLPRFNTGDTGMFACDSATGKLWIGKNGVWFLGGDPASGTGAQATTTGVVYPATSLYFDGSQHEARFSSGFYAPPAGFSGFGQGSYPANDGLITKVLRQQAGLPDAWRGAALPAGASDTHLREYLFFDAYNGGVGKIVGTVKVKSTPSNTPLRRKVLLLDEGSRLTIRETWSDALTGSYEFIGIAAGLPYTVISYDHTGINNGVIATNVTSETMP